MSTDTLSAPLQPALKKLAADIDAAFADLAADIADDAHEPLPPSLKDSLQRLDDEFDRLRTEGTFRSHASDELLRFYSLLYRLRQLVSELARCAEFANALDHSGVSPTGIHSEAGYNQTSP